MRWYTEQFLRFANKGNTSAEEFLKSRGVPEETISYVTTIINPQLKQKIVGYLAKNPQTPVAMLMEQVRTPIEQKQAANTPQEIQFVSAFQNMEVRKWVLATLRKMRMAAQVAGRIAPKIGTYQESNGALKTLTDLVGPMREIYDWYVMYVLESRVNPGNVGLENPITLNLNNLTYDQAKEYAHKWHLMSLGEGEGLEYFQDAKDVVYGPQWKNPKWQGWTIKQIKTQNNLKCEGNKVGHCVWRPGYYKKVLDGESRIYSLRDPSNTPYVTMEVDGSSWTFQQIFGNGPKTGNSDPDDELKAMIGEWMKSLGSVSIPNEDFNNYDYSDIGYRDTDSDLTDAIWGVNNPYGIPKDIAEFKFEDAYKHVTKAMNDGVEGLARRGPTKEVGNTLALAAIQSDQAKLANKKTFNQDLIYSLAFGKIRRELKHSMIDSFTKIPPQEQPIYIGKAKDYFTRMNTPKFNDSVYPVSKEYNEPSLRLLQERAVIERNSELKYPQLSEYPITKNRRNPGNEWEFTAKEIWDYISNSGISKEEWDLFMAKVVDERLETSSLVSKMQENQEHFFDHWNSGLKYPNEDEYETPELYEAALRQHEAEEQQEIENYEEDHLPYALDTAMVVSLRNHLKTNALKFPRWLVSYFNKSKFKPEVWGYMSRRKPRAKMAGWYSLAKDSQYKRPLEYSEIGHSSEVGFGDIEEGDNPGGCNYLWFTSWNGGFKVIKEVNYMIHADWPDFERANEAGTILFYGRVNTCKKMASLASFTMCEQAQKSFSPSKMHVCTRGKIQAELELHKRFGQDLNIKYFRNSDKFTQTREVA